MKEKEAAELIRDRIVGFGRKPADQFTANPLNWRVHPKKQQLAVAASLRDLGWIDVAIENVTTGNLVDGHERVWQALRNGGDVPYIQVELSPEEEAQALATLDPITGMATADAGILEELLRHVSTGEEAIQEMLGELAAQQSVPAEESWEDAFDGLPDEDRAPFQQMTFTLHDEQVEQVKAAITAAKALGPFVDSQNENSNGNALARIAEIFITEHGQS